MRDTPNFFLKQVVLISTLFIGIQMLTGCAYKEPVKDLPATGNVTVLIEKARVDEKEGLITIEVESYEELAERSIADKGAESLLTPQRYANIGTYFMSYQVGPENQIIASVFNNQEGRWFSDLWIFDKGKIRLTKTNYLNNDPSFSIDGESVYFVSSRAKKSFKKYDQASYIWRIRSNGAGGLTRIGTPSNRFFDPVESPDENNILFSSREFYGSNNFIWYMQKNGALPTQLKQGQFAKWIDNDTIVFSSFDESTELYTIWTSKIDGSMLTQIISDINMHCIHPAPSKDGQFIAYVKQMPGTGDLEDSRDIYIYNIKEGLSQQITTNLSRDDLPQWSNDGEFIYFRSSRGLRWNIWRLPTTFLTQ